MCTNKSFAKYFCANPDTDFLNHFSHVHRFFLLTSLLQDGIFVSEMFGHFDLPQTNCSSQGKQVTFTLSSEQRIGALNENTELESWGGLFPPFFILSSFFFLLLLFFP